MIASPVVRDELANPTIAAPIGLLCMAVEKVFGGSWALLGCVSRFSHLQCAYSCCMLVSDPCAVVFRLCMYHTPMTTSILSPQVHIYLCYLQDIARAIVVP